MTSTTIKNLQPIAIEHIPCLPIDDLREKLVEDMATGKRVVQFFGDSVRDRINLYVVMADDAASTLSIMKTDFTANSGYAALTPLMPAFHMFEREFFEQYGIEPAGHPWLKPVRRGIAGISTEEKPYSFFNMAGDQIHEVGVGPIHAGVIEPGHFRFACFGEDIHHLEIQLGFQHRGVESLFIHHQHRPSYLLHLAESIAGDTVIGHTTAFISAMEALRGILISRRAQLIRSLMLELERIGNHIGDLSALANDIAYLTGNAVFGALRTKVINTSLSICGSRFGRGMIEYGGVNFDLDDRLIGEIKANLIKIEQDVDLASEVLFSSPSVLARFEKTGVVSQQTAKAIGLVG
ncbi:MAG: hydrogenase, partial [Calditrichaeota bacterium]